MRSPYTRHDPPPAEPPDGVVELTAWTIAVDLWAEHHPDTLLGTDCAACRLAWPCASAQVADGVLAELCAAVGLCPPPGHAVAGHRVECDGPAGRARATSTAANPAIARRTMPNPAVVRSAVARSAVANPADARVAGAAVGTATTHDAADGARADTTVAGRHALTDGPAPAPTAGAADTVRRVDVRRVGAARLRPPNPVGSPRSPVDPPLPSPLPPSPDDEGLDPMPLRYRRGRPAAPGTDPAAGGPAGDATDEVPILGSLPSGPLSVRRY